PESAPREARAERGERNDRGERGDRNRRGDRGDREGREGRRGGGGGGGGGGGRNGHRRDEERRPREQKNIQDLLKEGQEVIVQVAKDPIGTKGARITSHISIPGRHLVFMPTVDHVGISRRIERDGERRRLREIVDRMRPEGTGFIVRTVADGVEGQKLEADIRFLIQVWNEIIRTKDKVGAPALLHPDLDLILRATRDLFTSDVNKLVIDDRDEYERILRFAREQAPHLESQIELYDGQEPVFDAYGIEQELKRAGQRKVWLKSGGYIIIDQAEALTAIDVNSGRYVGKKSLEETITKINVEAAKEIVYQLRLRNIGGIIIIDFIDMDKPQNRDKVFKSLQEALGRDKAKTNVLKISELGLVEMTRKRVRESITRMTTEPCSYCDGKGHIRSRVTVAYEIFREIRRDSPSFPEPVLVVNCHPEVARILQGAERDELRYLMDRFNKTIQVKPQNGYHQEQFDIYGRQERAEGGGEGGGEGGREGGRESGREGGREGGGREGGGREGGR
ncbi:MAG: Rne/Rng family ribonuclease, partial [Anaeromyxobacteraceae bacterium]